MQQTFGQRPMVGPAILGVALIVVGIVAMVMRQAGIQLFEEIGRSGWPLFIIVPGLVLLAASLVQARPRGIGLAIAGAVVTTVGGILLYQSRFDHYESWAYAWALIPAAAGAALVLYGLFAAQPGMVRSGTWLAAIAGVLFVAGAWFFEGVFAGDRSIIDAGNWWPVAVIILGAIVVLRAFVAPAIDRRPDGPAGSSKAPQA